MILHPPRTGTRRAGLWLDTSRPRCPDCGSSRGPCTDPDICHDIRTRRSEP